jgi:hypothetical protein
MGKAQLRVGWCRSQKMPVEKGPREGRREEAHVWGWESEPTQGYALPRPLLHGRGMTGGILFYFIS